MTIVLIPTCKPDVSPLLDSIIGTITGRQLVLASCKPVSASANRNLCLDQIGDTMAIMVDDDISGFYPGWTDDLLGPLVRDPFICMVSARLMTPEGLVGQTCSRCYDLTPDEIEVKSNGFCVMPSAAIAFRNIGLRFDENFRGSGFEDNDFCFQYLKANPSYKFIQSNRCKLIHANERKHQDENWEWNRHYFCRKWGVPLDSR
jgi:hypothetical protein